MHAKPIFLSVVVPAYNEEERIGKTLQSIDEYLRNQSYSYEVLVVDDGSKDTTAELVGTFASRIKNLRLLRHEQNRGKGWAVRTGMLQAAGLYRLFMDADGSTSIEQWGLLKSGLDQGSDIAISSRHVAGSTIRIRQAFHRRILGHAFRMLVRRIMRLPFQDTQNGFKAFRAEAAERIFKRQRVRGWAFDVEVLSIAKALQYSMIEVPITWVDDERSKVTLMAMPVMLKDILRIRVEMLTHSHKMDAQLAQPKFGNSSATYRNFPKAYEAG